MIKLITGIPGSGKTYRAVYDLYEERHKYYIIHNIDGLKEDQIEQGKYIQRMDMTPFTDEGMRAFNDFFHVENQTKISKECRERYGRPILVIIDEAHEYLRTYNKGVASWLSYHRHLGQDIWLLTQNKYKLAKDYQSISEIEVQAKKGFVFQSFIYSYFEQGERVKTDKLPKKQEIYDLYKSFQMQEEGKKKSNLFKFAIAMGILSVSIGVYWMFFQLPSAFRLGKSEKGKERIEVVKQKSENSSVMANEVKRQIVPEYSYIGMVYGKAYLIDQWGNVWEWNQVKEGSITVLNREKMDILSVDVKEGSKRLRIQPVIQQTPATAPGRGGAGAGGKAGATEGGISSVQMGEGRKVKVDIR